jgi:hypothetical protein
VHGWKEIFMHNIQRGTTKELVRTSHLCLIFSSGFFFFLLFLPGDVGCRQDSEKVTSSLEEKTNKQKQQQKQAVSPKKLASICCP